MPHLVVSGVLHMAACIAADHTADALELLVARLKAPEAAAAKAEVPGPATKSVFENHGWQPHW